MSFLDWSSFHISDRSGFFYYVFICLNIICIASIFVRKGNLGDIRNVHFLRKNKVIPIEIYNLIYIGCVLLENRYLSGYLFPSLHGLDVHTGRMPFIYFITTATYIIVVGDIIEFITTHRVRYVAYAVFAAILNVVSKAARVDAGIAIIQVGSFILFYFLSKEKKIKVGNKTKKKKKNNLPLLIATAVIVLIIVSNGIKVGDDRMNSYGMYNTVYSIGIGYHGPASGGELLPYYYGYFGLSFDNLAFNIDHSETKNNYVGLNAFRCLYFGILQFDNLFDLDGSATVKANTIRCKAAAVTTIFWDFYYDYGIFIFIPISITFFIAIFLSKRLVKKQNIFYLLLYFFWIPLWMFGSFDNRMYDFQIIWQVLILWLIYRNRFVLITDTNKDYVSTEKSYKRRHIRIKLGR